MVGLPCERVDEESAIQIDDGVLEVITLDVEFCPIVETIIEDFQIVFR